MEPVTVSVKRHQQPLQRLHAVGHLLQMGRFQATSLTHHKGVAALRPNQQQKLGQHLLASDVKGWITPFSSGFKFWTGLRWSGAEFILA